MQIYVISCRTSPPVKLLFRSSSIPVLYSSSPTFHWETLNLQSIGKKLRGRLEHFSLFNEAGSSSRTSHCIDSKHWLYCYHVIKWWTWRISKWVLEHGKGWSNPSFKDFYFRKQYAFRVTVKYVIVHSPEQLLLIKVSFTFSVQLGLKLFYAVMLQKSLRVYFPLEPHFDLFSCPLFVILWFFDSFRFFWAWAWESQLEKENFPKHSGGTFCPPIPPLIGLIAPNLDPGLGTVSIGPSPSPLVRWLIWFFA